MRISLLKIKQWLWATGKRDLLKSKIQWGATTNTGIGANLHKETNDKRKK